MELSGAIDGSKIVTGYIEIVNQKVLHSVVYDYKNGEIFVFDWTRNLYLKRDDYIKLTNFVELAFVDGNVVLDDILNMVGNLYLSNKAYLLFRDEIIRDMGRNLEIFSVNENLKKHLDVNKDRASRKR